MSSILQSLEAGSRTRAPTGIYWLTMTFIYILYLSINTPLHGGPRLLSDKYYCVHISDFQASNAKHV
jgi:hypothetical protein